MRLDSILLENTADRLRQELIYNLKHRASQDTINAVSQVMRVAEEPDEAPQQAGQSPLGEEDQGIIGQADDWMQRYVRDPAVRYGVMSPGTAGWKDGKSPAERPGQPPSDFDPVRSGYGMLSKGYGALRSGLGKLGRWEYDTLSNLAPGLFPPEGPKAQQATIAPKVANPSEPTFKQKSDELISSTDKLIQYTKARQSLDRQAAAALNSGDRAGYDRYKKLISALDAAQDGAKTMTAASPQSTMPAGTGVARASVPVGSLPQAATGIPRQTGVARSDAPVGSYPAAKRSAAGTYTSPYEPKRQAAGTYTAPYDPTVVKKGDNIWTMFNKKYGRAPTPMELKNLAKLNGIRNWKRLTPGSRIAWNESLDEAMASSKDLLIKHIMSLNPNTPKDAEEIEKLYTFAMRHVIRDEVSKVLAAKELPSTFTRTISNWFIDGDGTYEDRIRFLQEMRTNGYLETSALLDTTPNNFNSITKFKSNVYDSVKDSFMQYEGKIGGVSIGKGELYCIFFAQGVRKGAPGDLRIDGQEAEVKSVKARFLATTGYGSTVSFFPHYRKMVQALVPKLQLPTDPNWFNWNYKGLHDLSNIFARSGKPRECKELLDKTLAALYVESTPSQRSRVVDVVSNDGSFDPGMFLHAWVLMQFEYYKSIDGFDGILFINPSNYNFLFVEDALQLADAWEGFKIMPSLSWKESRNITSQISLL